MFPVILLLACGGPADSDSLPVDDGTRPWNGALEGSADVWPAVRGLQPSRAILHLHSPLSHDACDGAGVDEDNPTAGMDEECLADMRAGLCTTRIDAAFITDHPDYSAHQDFETTLLSRGSDTPIEREGVVVGNRIDCGDGHTVAFFPGNEDALMPVAFDRAVLDDPTERLALLNRDDPEALQAMKDAGATVLIAHAEGKDRATLEAHQDAGLKGMEIFQLHAMFAPDIREEDLGLSAFGWLEDIAPFTSPEGTAEPDLLFLGVLQTQAPNLAHYDALMARGPIIGIGGTDAHQNVMNYDLRDQERGDSYRRMLRWFSNVLWVAEDTPQGWQEAVEAGRNAVVFEALGTPRDLGVTVDDGATQELGSTTGLGTMDVACSSLSSESPQGPLAAELDFRLIKDGQQVASGCGAHELTEAGVYRVEVWVTPHHLVPFLGDTPDPWLKPYPWILYNGFRVGL